MLWKGSDALATAKAIAAAIKDLDYDIIFAGQRGVDDDQGLVGATVAELLGYSAAVPDCEG